MDSKRLKNLISKIYKDSGYSKSYLIDFLKSYDNDGFDESYDQSMFCKTIGNLTIIVSPFDVVFIFGKTI